MRGKVQLLASRLAPGSNGHVSLRCCDRQKGKARHGFHTLVGDMEGETDGQEDGSMVGRVVGEKDGGIVGRVVGACQRSAKENRT